MWVDPWLGTKTPLPMWCGKKKKKKKKKWWGRKESAKKTENWPVRQEESQVSVVILKLREENAPCWWAETDWFQCYWSVKEDEEWEFTMGFGNEHVNKDVDQQFQCSNGGEGFIWVALTENEREGIYCKFSAEGNCNREVAGRGSGIRRVFIFLFHCAKSRIKMIILTILQSTLSGVNYIHM